MVDDSGEAVVVGGGEVVVDVDVEVEDVDVDVDVEVDVLESGEPFHGVKTLPTSPEYVVYID